MIDLTVITKKDRTTEKINGFFQLKDLIHLLESFTYTEETIKVTIIEIKGEVDYGR